MRIYFDKDKSKQVLADTGEHIVKTDQPEMGGGDNEAPAPFNLFLASLGTCAGIYIKNFCDQRGIDSSEITLDQKVNFHPIKRMIDRIVMIINVPADFPEKYDNALIKSAEQCAVKRHLHSDIEMKTRVERN